MNFLRSNKFEYVRISSNKLLNLNLYRYVIVGNHRDAWGHGAADPSSGTAAMVEVARTIEETMSAYGWRPRRSIIFVSFAASEYGHIGSQVG